MSAESNRIARELTLLVLYASDIRGESLHDVCNDSNDLLRESADKWTREVASQLNERLDLIDGDVPRLDEILQPLCPDWRLERMATVDRNILRLGIAELEAGEVLPLIVVNACVELGKEYGGDKTHAFINGVLDGFCRNQGIELKRGESGD